VDRRRDFENIKPAYFDLIGYLKYFDIDEWCDRPMRQLRWKDLPAVALISDDSY